MLRAGSRPYVLARELGLGRNTVRRIRDRNGVPALPSSAAHWASKLVGVDLSDAVLRYEAGASLESLAAEFGVTRNTINKHLQEAGAKVRGPGAVLSPLNEEQRAYVRKWAGRKGRQSLARDLGATEGAVVQAMREMDCEVYARTSGPGSAAYRGGRQKVNGYVRVLVEADSPYASMRDVGGYVAEHRLVMARTVGRPLLRSETVHHIDGDKTNNEPSNLQLRQGNHGSGVLLRCRGCGSHDVEAVPLG